MALHVVNGLLDTNILIAQFSPRERAPDLTGFTGLFVSSLSWGELTRGLHMTTELSVYKARAARLASLQGSFGAGLSFDDDCVRAYDAVMQSVLNSGGSPRAHLIDRMLAATAIAHNLTVITRDRTGFTGLEDLLTLDVR